MSTTKKVEVRCLNCGEWSVSPIYFGDLESFDTASLGGNMMKCPHCNKMTDCNKENMRLKSDDEGFIGNDTF